LPDELAHTSVPEDEKFAAMDSASTHQPVQIWFGGKLSPKPRELPDGGGQKFHMDFT
jgi:hypothetical protein